MSYNRHDCLLNCITSIETNISDPHIAIFDDNSDDARLTGYLETLAPRYRVFRQSAAAGDGVYLGGLHANMNWALDIAEKEGFEYVFFIQDDQQVVRKVEPEFWRQCVDVFQSNRDICQIIPIFFKGFFPNGHYAKIFDVIRKPDGYLSKTVYVSDVGIVSVERFAEREFRYAETEHESGILAQGLGMRLALHANPIMMYTPWPRTFREFGWKFSIFAKLNELGVKAGCNPFKPMSPDRVRALLKRDVSELPIAEKFLDAERALRKPWWYTCAYDVRKLHQMKHLVSFSWINNGPVEYMNLVKALHQDN